MGVLAARQGRVRVVRRRDSGGTMTAEIGRWCYRGWVRCESCEVQQRHPVGAESRADFECEHCGATLRWTDEDETPKGSKSWLWRVVE